MPSNDSYQFVPESFLCGKLPHRAVDIGFIATSTLSWSAASRRLQLVLHASPGALSAKPKPRRQTPLSTRAGYTTAPLLDLPFMVTHFLHLLALVLHGQASELTKNPLPVLPVTAAAVDVVCAGAGTVHFAGPFPALQIPCTYAQYAGGPRGGRGLRMLTPLGYLTRGRYALIRSSLIFHERNGQVKPWQGSAWAACSWVMLCLAKIRLSMPSFGQSVPNTLRSFVLHLKFRGHTIPYSGNARTNADAPAGPL